MYKSKVDNNQPDILKCLKKAGISYKPVHQIKGFCDLVVGFKNKNYLFEIKNDHKRKLTGLEPEFHDNWGGQIHIVTCFNEILDIITKLD